MGQGRFGWMLREDGRLLDDGVTFRLGDAHYFMFAGTGAADHVHVHIERLLQLEWPSLRVFLTVVTSQWTNVCVCRAEGARGAGSRGGSRAASRRARSRP